MVKRLLVTTALEETWPTDGQPILFLGEWCKLFDRKHVWEKLDYTLATYHWDDRDKLYQDTIVSKSSMSKLCSPYPFAITS